MSLKSRSSSAFDAQLKLGLRLKIWWWGESLQDNQGVITFSFCVYYLKGLYLNQWHISVYHILEVPLYVFADEEKRNKKEEEEKEFF